MTNRVTSLLNIKYPIIQGGMVWVSGWKLAAAVSNSGGLGLLGAGSMYPEILREHIIKCKKATKKPFGVNVPLLYPNIQEIMNIIVEENVKIVFTSAGNPKIWTSFLKEKGIKVVHVVSSVKFALKAQNAGVDAIVCEGFEAGGHNGLNETTTLTLVPTIKNDIKLPLIAAGGIASGRAMYAAIALGADGVQIGSRFAATIESSAHEKFKEKITALKDGDTMLTLKEIGAVRLIKNKFYQEIEELYNKNISKEELRNYVGRARIKKGIFEGDLDNGKLEIGQIASIINKVQPVAEVVEEIINDFFSVQKEMADIHF